MRLQKVFYAFLALCLLALACNLGQPLIVEEAPAIFGEQPTRPARPENPRLGTNLIQAEQLVYLGAFRLPGESGGSGWNYSGQGLAYFPNGDPAGPQDGFPGSLFGIGHDHQMFVSEIAIPVPVPSRDLDSLNTAETLQPFVDASAGRVDFAGMDLPVADLAFADFPGDDMLYFIVGQHFQDFEPVFGRASADFSQPAFEGLFGLADFSNYATNDYLFEIPAAWAAQIGQGYALASGRFREGVWGGGGPALFAFDPGALSGQEINDVRPLLLFGRQQPGNPEIQFDESMQMDGYQLADHWSGGAWLTAGDSAAVVFVGTKAKGNSWYGFANGVEWAYDCADQAPSTCPEVPDWPYDNRGYWAESYEAQLIFFDPAELVSVARGETESWTPQPYAVLPLNEFLFAPEIDLENYKRDLVGAMAFDRVNSLLYIVERLADEYRSVIHVWQVED